MKKSRAVHVPLVSTLAAAAIAAGCGSRQPGWQTCVDRDNGTVAAQEYCDQEAARTTTGYRYGSPYRSHYHWYYYPRSYYWDAPAIGSRVPPGGSFSATPFHSTPMARTGVVRGGFGHTASGHSSGS